MRATLHSHKIKSASTQIFLTFFCNLMTEVHFFSKSPAYFLSTSSFYEWRKEKTEAEKGIQVLLSINKIILVSV